MTLIFVNRYFHPDHSATSQILADLAFFLAGEGHTVRVVTSRQIYDDPAARLPPAETVRGVRVDRVWSSRFGRHGLAGRAVDYLSFYVAAMWALWRLTGAGDVVVAKTDPPLLSVGAGWVARRRGAVLVNWLHDLFPEVARALGVGFAAPPLGPVLAWLRDRSLRRAAVNVVPGRRMAARLEGRGLAPGRLKVIPNWADDTAITPLAHGGNPLRAEWDLADAFVVAYSGNLGRAHEIDTVIGAAERLRGRADIVFLFIGGGHHHPALADAVRDRGLANVRFRPYQPRAALRRSLAVADVHWISLRPELEGLVVPSKFYGIAAAGRPILMVGDVDGEIARLVARHRCGLAVPVGDGAAFADAVLALAADPARRAEMGRRARAMLDAHYSRHRSSIRWNGVLAGVAGEAAADP